MNVHHLELFYYVVCHKGIAQAARHMPYGIQRPAISSQLLQLEENLGKKLFIRQPFKLTNSGQELFEFIRPFFANLKHTAQRLQRDGIPQLRIVTSATVLRDHIHEVLQNMRERFPDLALTFREANQPVAESLIANHEMDLAISMLLPRHSSSMRFFQLIEVSPVLLVREESPFTVAEDVFRKAFALPLISLPSHTSFMRLFQQELKRRKIRWRPQMEVDSLDVVRNYVSKGFGIGISVKAPRTLSITNVREIYLPGFPFVRIGAFWHGKLPPLSQYFLDLMKTHARLLSAECQRSI